MARILEVTQEAYFQDPCDVPSLSQSIAHTMVAASPLHAWTEHPRFGNERGGPTKSASDGALIHKLILGKGQEIALIKADDFRTNGAKEARARAILAGKLPVLEHKFAEAQAIAEILIGNLSTMGFEFSGQSEVPFEWDEAGIEGPVRCRGLMDHVFLESGVIYDVKSINCAHPKTCAKHMVDYGYDIQHAAYTSALGKYLPLLEGRIDFVFLFVELAPPYAVVPARPDGMMRELGEARWGRAVRLWEHCLKTNHWPAYASCPIELGPPPWVMQEELIQYER